MNKKLLAASVAASIGVLGSGIASAMEFSVYGSIRAGAYQQDVDNDDSSDQLQLGVDNFGSRIGIKGSEDLGNGLSAGFRFERSTDSPGGLSRRHENVWLQGSWGKLTLGQTDNAYRDAANWDQSWWLGGQLRVDDGGSRLNGIRYDSNFAGPFSFSLQATADDQGSTDDQDGIERFIATAHLDIGDVATINLGSVSNENETPTEDNLGSDQFVISANGSVGGLGWYVGYEDGDSNVDENGDHELVGVFLGHAVGEGNYLYAEFEDLIFDDKDEADADAFLLGYSHKIGPGTTFIAEYATNEKEGINGDVETDTIWIGIKVDF